MVKITMKMGSTLDLSNSANFKDFSKIPFSPGRQGFGDSRKGKHKGYLCTSFKGQSRKVGQKFEMAQLSSLIALSCLTLFETFLG